MKAVKCVCGKEPKYDGVTSMCHWYWCPDPGCSKSTSQRSEIGGTNQEAMFRWNKHILEGGK